MNTPGDNGDIGGDMGGAVVLEARVAAQDLCQAAAWMRGVYDSIAKAKVGSFFWL